MKVLITIFMITIFSITLTVTAGVPLDPYKGFSHKGKAINPKCVNLLQTWLSESSEYGIITKSIIVDSCQDSNLAFEGNDYSVSDGGQIFYYEDPKDRRSSFGYRVIGRTLNNIWILRHEGYIGLYSLKEQDVIFDFSEHDAKSVKVLTKLSDAWIPCFESAEIRGNTLVIVKNVWDSAASRASQCTDESETRTFNLRHF